MSSVAATDRPEAPLFSDGVGDRVVAADGATGELLQILRIAPGLTSVPSFEFALRERAARLANFRHACYARVRRIDRTMAPSPALAVVSDHIEGTRLSDILRAAEDRQLSLDINAALCLIRQLVPAIAVLHENARDVAHGLIAPERLVVTPNARLVVVEHVLGAAIEQLQYGRERLWQAFGIGMPPSAGLARFDHRADVTAMGLVALALILGRPLRQDEFPHRIGTLLGEARERTPLGDEQPLSAPLRAWLARALQLDTRRALASGPEALAALEDALAEDASHVAAPVALETFMSRYIAALLDPAPPVVTEAPSPVPPVVVAAPAPPAVVARQAVAPLPQQAAKEPLELTELLDVRQLPPAEEQPVPVRSLFNPDEPFSAPPAAAEEEPAPSAKGRSRVPILAAVALLVLAAGGFGAWKFLGKSAAGPEMGTLAVQSNPSGVLVFVDGVERGRTPARVSVAPGSHILELRGSGVPRVIPFNVNAGAEISQYLEFAEAPAAGQLAIQSDPPGAKVLVDGTDRGVAPITITDLAPGDHEVVLQSEGATARHTVTVQAGGTASLVVPLAAAASGPVSGWISLKAPFTVDILEQGQLLGTSDTDRIMLAAGRHELEFVNEGLGYRASRVIQVPPGKVTALPLDLPRGVVNLNATPWAEVWIDGERVGETPIGNLAVAIGPHEIVFKHPQLGEKRQAISVTLAAPTRVSVDMK